MVIFLMEHVILKLMIAGTHCAAQMIINATQEKKEHSSKIKLCVNSVNRKCPYNRNCWYKHEEIQDHTENQNQELFNKFCDMMEKCTHRIVTIENNLQMDFQDDIQYETKRKLNRQIPENRNAKSKFFNKKHNEQTTMS